MLGYMIFEASVIASGIGCLLIVAYGLLVQKVERRVIMKRRLRGK